MLPTLPPIASVVAHACIGIICLLPPLSITTEAVFYFGRIFFIMYEPTLEEIDIKIQEVLIDARKNRQSWFRFEREESRVSRIVWYTLYKNDRLWVKLSLTAKGNKGVFEWVEPPQHGDSEIISIFDIYHTWLFGLRGWELKEEPVIKLQDDKKDEDEKDNYTKSPSIEYPGSVSHFRAWMDRHLIINGEEVKIKDNNDFIKYRIVYMPQAKESNREVWLIQLIIPATKDAVARMDTKGMILAVEDVSNRTKIEFLDGKFYMIPTIPWSFRKSMSESDKRDFEMLTLTTGAPIGKDFPEIVKSIIEELTKEDNHKEPLNNPLNLWEKIPNIGWDREALKLWHEHYSHAEIGQKLHKDEQTVKNKIRHLRKEHGEEIVPSRRKKKST